MNQAYIDDNQQGIIRANDTSGLANICRVIALCLIFLLPLSLAAKEREAIPPKQAIAAIQKHLDTINQSIKYMDEKYYPPASKKTIKRHVDAVSDNDVVGIYAHLDARSDEVYFTWDAIRSRYYAFHQQQIKMSLRVAEKKKIYAEDLDYLAKGMKRWLVIDDQISRVVRSYVQFKAKKVVSGAKQRLAQANKLKINSEYLALAGEKGRFFDAQEKQALAPVLKKIAQHTQRTKFLSQMESYLNGKSRDQMAHKKIFSGLDVEPRLPIDEAKDTYKITTLDISNLGWRKQRTTFNDQLKKIGQDIEHQERKLQSLEADFGKNDSLSADIQKQITLITSKLKPILDSMRGLETQSAPEPYRADYVRYKYQKGRISRLEDEIIRREEGAKNHLKAGKKSKASRERAKNTELFIQLAEEEQRQAETEKKLKAYFTSLETKYTEQKELSIKLKDEFNDRKRKQQRISDERQLLQNKQNIIATQINSLHQQRNAVLDKKSEFLANDKPKIETIYVRANGKTVYAANASKSPKKALNSVEALVQKAGFNLDRSKKQFQTYKARFEVDFDDSRTALSKLGGATGAIMQTAYLQAGAESLFYFIDIAEQWASGGPVAALTDAFAKGVVAWTSNEPAFKSADEQKVLASLFGNSSYSGARNEFFSLSTLSDTGIERARTQAYVYGVRDKALNDNAVKLINAARSNDKEFTKAAKIFGKVLDKKDKVATSLTKGTNYLEHLRTSRDSLKGVLKEYTKDLAKNYLKESAKAVEEGAWADYFIQDMVARKSFQLFQRMREEYWQSLDIYRDLVQARNEILNEYKNYDGVNNMLVSINEEIEQDSYLQVSVYGPSDEYTETVTLGDLKLLVLNKDQYYWQADKLNKEDKGDVALSIVQLLTKKK